MADPVDIDDAPTAWREAGTGEVVVFLHGLGGTRSAWEPQLRALCGRWRCVAWDMPGYGASAPADELTFGFIADAVAGLLDRLGAEHAHLVGLSFGGMHALHTALAHPDRVLSLVLADTSPAFGLDGTRRHDWMAARLDPIDAGATPADIAERVLRAITAPGFDGPALHEAMDAFARISPEGFRAACHCLPDHDVRERLAEIVVPALCVVGAEDRETPPAYARALADGLVNSRYIELPGVGHLTPSEAPAEFNRLVADFLDEVSR